MKPTFESSRQLRQKFETWVNNVHMLNRRNAPGHTDEYEHPWTAGAWAAWQECHKNSVLNPNRHIKD